MQLIEMTVSGGHVRLLYANEGKNGHDAGVTPFPLMTHSGHQDAAQKKHDG